MTVKRHRLGHNAMRRNGLLKILVKQLDAAERATDPASTTAEGKDHNAFATLLAARGIIEELAGWALHHVYGLSLEGHYVLPLQPGGQTESGSYTGTKALAEYRLSRLNADKHSHEKVGAAEFDRPPDAPSDRRLILRNLVFAGAGGLPDWLRQELVEALDTLQSGATHPLLAPAKSSGMRRDIAKARLRVVSFVKFQARAYGISEEAARQQIDEKYNISADTLKQWESRLPKSCLGIMEVNREYTFAKNAASHVDAVRIAEMRGEEIKSRQVAKRAEQKYGADALRDAVLELRAIERGE